MSPWSSTDPPSTRHVVDTDSSAASSSSSFDAGVNISDHHYVDENVCQCEGNDAEEEKSDDVKNVHSYGGTATSSSSLSDIFAAYWPSSSSSSSVASASYVSYQCPFSGNAELDWEVDYREDDDESHNVNVLDGDDDDNDHDHDSCGDDDDEDGKEYKDHEELEEELSDVSDTDEELNSSQENPLLSPSRRKKGHRLRTQQKDASVRLFSLSNSVFGDGKNAFSYFSSSSSSSLHRRRDWLTVLCPALRWLRTNEFRRDMKADIVAGLTVGVVAVPITMSDAAVAGLPVQYGLFASFVPAFAYALFGQSRELSVGSAALACMVLREGLEDIVYGDRVEEDANGRMEKAGFNLDNDPALQLRYEILAVRTAFIAGIMYLCLGLCRFGFLCRLLNVTIVSGFTSGAAIIIALSQLGYFLGCSLDGNDATVPSYLIRAYENRASIHGPTCTVGAITFLYLTSSKLIAWAYSDMVGARGITVIKNSAPLVVSVVSIVASSVLSLETERGIRVVGHVPSGLPMSTMSWIFGSGNDDDGDNGEGYEYYDGDDYEYYGDDVDVDVDDDFNGNDSGNGDGFALTWTTARLFRTAAFVVGMGVLKSVATAQHLAHVGGYELDADAELIGLGLANLAGSAFQSMPVMGSLGRSGVNVECGARSAMSSVFSATLILLVMLALSPLFGPLPYAVLGAIVISSVMGLIDYAEPMSKWSTNRKNFYLWMVCFCCTIFFGAEKGCVSCLVIAIGIEAFKRGKGYYSSS